MILSFINIRKVPREVLKTSGDLANVNEWKIMFDPYIDKLYFDYIFGFVLSCAQVGSNPTKLDGKVVSLRDLLSPHLLDLLGSKCVKCKKIWMCHKTHFVFVIFSNFTQQK